MIKSLIVDDEKAPREVLAELIKNFCPDVEVVGMASDTFEAAGLIATLQPDLVFLDIEMPGRTGIQFLQEQKEISYKVIFTTAFDKYAIQALRLSALDYLLKPIEIKDLVKAIHKISSDTENDNGKLKNLITNTGNTSQKIALPHSEGVEFITIDSILYCMSEGSYTHIVTENKNSLLISRNLKTMEEVLSDFRFCRCHKSYLVNLNKIKRIDKDGNLCLNNDTIVPLTTKSRVEMLRLIENNL